MKIIIYYRILNVSSDCLSFLSLLYIPESQDLFSSNKITQKVTELIVVNSQKKRHSERQIPFSSSENLGRYSLKETRLSRFLSCNFRSRLVRCRASFSANRTCQSW
ncbi:hypothetical protein O6H91_Y079100 [Diphasiastrum complanatum]|nr:hypothetical protein O6H91_Y079100 [Diphasiastrum complanatum]